MPVHRSAKSPRLTRVRMRDEGEIQPRSSAIHSPKKAEPRNSDRSAGATDSPKKCKQRNSDRNAEMSPCAADSPRKAKPRNTVHIVESTRGKIVRDLSPRAIGVSPNFESLPVFKNGQRLLVTKKFQLREKEESSSHILRAVGETEGVVFLCLGTNNGMKVRCMIDGAEGWFTEVDAKGSGHVTEVSDAFYLSWIFVESKKIAISGVYAFDGIDDHGYPKYCNTIEPMSFSFSRRQAGQWIFSSKTGSVATIQSAALTPAAILNGAFRRSYYVNFITLYDKERVQEGRYSPRRTVAGDGLFVDHEFPPEWKSIDKDPTSRPEYKIKWVRVNKLYAGEGNKITLFGSGAKTHSDHVIQGTALGDCWFLSVLAALADRPEVVAYLFVDGLTLRSDGMCTIRFYDFISSSWRMYTVDTLIPCKEVAGGPYVPMFAQLSPAAPYSNCRAVWPLLLEKAMAKYCGSFLESDGGLPTFAFQMCTGQNWQSLYGRVKLGKELLWTEQGLHVERQKNEPSEDNRPSPMEYTHRLIDDDAFFDVLFQYDARDYIITAGAQWTVNGIVGSHAYTVPSIIKVADGNGKEWKFAKIRNPWAKGEWTGPFADSSPEWERNPQLKRLLQHGDPANDGIFFMPFSEFVQHFPAVFVSPTSHEVKMHSFQRQEDRTPNKHDKHRLAKILEKLDTFNGTLTFSLPGGVCPKPISTKAPPQDVAKSISPSNLELAQLETKAFQLEELLAQQRNQLLCLHQETERRRSCRLSETKV